MSLSSVAQAAIRKRYCIETVDRTEKLVNELENEGYIVTTEDYVKGMLNKIVIEDYRMNSSPEILDTTQKRYDTDETQVNEKGGKQSKFVTRLDLVPAKAIREVGVVLHHGANKYGIDNWRLIEAREHLSHALQHCYAYLDKPSTEDLSHAATRLLMALEMHLLEMHLVESSIDEEL
jgi:hypothetical protein